MSKHSSRAALRIAILYVVIAGVWILFSDELLMRLVQDPATLGEWSMLKGCAFVAVTGLLLYFEMSRQFRRGERVQRAEAALGESERLLNEMGRTAKIGGWELDPATGEGRWTEEVARIHDLDPETKPNKAMGFSFFHGDSRPKIEAAVKEAIEHGTPYDLELEIISAKGAHKQIRTICEPVVENGQVVRLRGAFQDITERKQAEQALTREKMLMRMMIDQLGQQIYVKDRESRFLLANENVAHAIGVSSSSELLGKTDADFYPQELAGKFRAEEERVLAGEPLLNDEQSLRRPDGSERTGLASKLPFRDSDGKVIGLIGITRDITEQKRIETALQHERNLLRTLMDLVPDFIFIKDTEGRFLSINRALARCYGDDPAKILGHTDAEFLSAELAERFRSSELKVLATDSCEAYEDTVTFADGKQRTVITNMAAFRDAQGNPAGLVGIGHDITGRKRAEAAREEIAGRFKSLFDNMLNGFAHCRMIFENGRPVDYVYLNVNPAFEKLTGLKNVIGRKVSEVIPGLHEADPQLLEIYGRVAATGAPEQFEIYVEALKNWFSISVYSPAREHFVALFDVVTARKHTEEEREITMRMLSLFHACDGLRELMQGVTALLSEWLGCEAVGIRLRDGEDYPYFETRGFSREFVQVENRLCHCDEKGRMVRDADGRAVLECMCGNVLCGRFDPAKPFFTETGSFWSNSISSLASNISAEDLPAHTRGRCTSEGYESVALVPLRTNHASFGLIQINDKRRDRFTPERIALLERLADSIAVAIAHRQGAQKLRESETQSRAMFETASIGMAQSDPITGRCIRVNQKMCEITGYTAAELQGMCFPEITHPDDRKADWEASQRIVRGEARDYRMEKRYIRKDGGIAWVNVNMTVLHDAAGKPTRTMATIEDITTRKQAEEALRQNEALLRSVTDNSNDVIFVKDRDCRFVFMNPAGCRLIGKPLEELIGRSKAEHASGATPAIKMEDDDRRVMESGQMETIEEEIRAADGTRRVFLTTKMPRHDGQGNVIGLIGMARDITERKQAEEALLRSESKYRKIFENVQDIFYQTDTEGRITEISPSIERYSGYSREELVGRPVQEVYRNPEDRAVLLQTLKTKGEVVDYELPLRTKDGRTVYTSVNSHLLFDAEGRPAGIEGSLRDVNERRLAREALCESEERYRSAVDNIREVVFQTDAEGRWALLNKAWEEITGFGVAESIGKVFLDFVHPDDRQRNQELFQPLIERKKDHCRHQVRYLHKDGGFRWIEAHARLTLGAQGEVTGTTGTLRDVTAARQAEEQLRKLSHAVEQSPTSIVITDPAGCIEYVNPTFTALTGYTMDEVRGKNPRVLKSGETPPEAYQKMWQTITQGRVWHGEFHNRKKNGELYWEFASISPIVDESGRITHFLAVKENIDTRKNLEDQLRHVQKMEAIGQLAGGVAHDFNNILAVIQMQADLIRMEGELSTEQEACAAEIEKASQRAASLTRQLLLFSRRQAMQPRDLNLNEIVAGIIKMLQRILGEDIRIHIACNPEPLFVHADEGMLDQVLMNLAVNARDAMPGGGRLVIETTRVEIGADAAALIHGARPGTYACVTVMDTGTGIAPGDLPHIFEPFFTTKDVGKGTGLGLATVFGIVQQHQGWVDVLSTPGVGSTFRVHLPLLARQETSEVRHPLATARGGSETILVTEDDPDLRLLIRSVLAHLGYRMLEASTAIEALRVWQENRDDINLLLTDLVMPDGMSGIELAQRIREESAQLKVIFMSGYSPEIAGKNLVLQKGVDFLPKPFHAHELAAALRVNLDAAAP